jgi:hypothetical protein
MTLGVEGLPVHHLGQDRVTASQGARRFAEGLRFV